MRLEILASIQPPSASTGSPAKIGRRGNSPRASLEVTLMPQSLGAFIERIRSQTPQDFQVVTREVDPVYEITALVVKLEREARRRPVLLFERVRGSRFAVLTNLHASRARLAAA